MNKVNPVAVLLFALGAYAVNTLFHTSNKCIFAVWDVTEVPNS